MPVAISLTEVLNKGIKGKASTVEDDLGWHGLKTELQVGVVHVDAAATIHTVHRSPKSTCPSQSHEREVKAIITPIIANSETNSQLGCRAEEGGR